MNQTINRRRFVGLVGVSGIVGTAGCLNNGDDDPGDSSGPNSSVNEPTTAQEFAFPPGADANGIVADRVLSGVRDVIAATDRYRISQEYEFDYGNNSSNTGELTYDVEAEQVLERQVQNGTEIERLMTPDRALCRATEVDGDRSGQWTADAVDLDAVGARNFHLYPLEKTTVPTLLEGASLDFDEIVTENEQRYARYSGEVSQHTWATHQWWDSARVAHELESSLEGSLSILLSENGAIHTVEYDLTGEVARESSGGREVTATDVRGTIQLEYDNLKELSTPEWSESDEFREFEIGEWNDSPVYELAAGPALPGSTELVYAEFHVMARVGEERHIETFSKPTDFEAGDHLFMGFERDEFVLSRYSISGSNALEVADEIEVSVYLYHPEKGRSLVYHEEVQP